LWFSLHYNMLFIGIEKNTKALYCNQGTFTINITETENTNDNDNKH
jgi:hypothetical protein